MSPWVRLTALSGCACMELQLLRRVGVTTVYVTHNQHEAPTMADRGGDGWPDSPDRLAGRHLPYPTSRFVATFMGDANFIDGVVGEVVGRCGSLLTGGSAIPGCFIADQVVTLAGAPPRCCARGCELRRDRCRCTAGGHGWHPRSTRES